MKGYYSEHKLYDVHYPSSPGWEGAGIVVAYGGRNLAGRALMGRRVSFVRNVKDDKEMIAGGTYQQYVLA